MTGAHAPAPECARCHSPLEPGELRCAVCGLAVPAGVQSPARMRAQVVRCEGCNAAVSYSVEVRAPRCAFCGWTAHVELAEDPREQVEAVVPFAVSPEQARGAVRTWLGRRGFFAPSDLVQRAQVEDLRPLWWVAWVVDAEARVSWTADSDAGARRAAWAPHAGQTDLRISRLLVPASRGLSEAECLQLGPGYDIATAAPSPRGPEGAVMETFELERSSARRLVQHELEAHARAELEAGHIPGHRFRHLKTSVLLRGLRTRRLALPAYVLAYRYRNRLYRVLVHGQRAERVLGEAPVSALKVVGVVLAVLAVLAAVLWLQGR